VPDYGNMSVPSVWRNNRTTAASKVDALSSAGVDDFEIPAFLRKQAD
jgi:cell division protein FtsZ